MPRQARKKSETGIYHIIIRGVNGQKIFLDDKDRLQFIKLLKRFKAVGNFELYCYCLMGNHLHLLIKENTEPVSLIIKRISSSYVLWFNKKYERYGHLFQERFKSEPVETDDYFLTVVRYIHQNPVKAGICNSVGGYAWSSYNEFLYKAVLTDVNFVLSMFVSHDRKAAVGLFKQFVNQRNEDNCLEYNERVRITDKEVADVLKQFGIKHCDDLLAIDQSKRTEILKKLKEIDGITIRQIVRVTGLSKSIVERA